MNAKLLRLSVKYLALFCLLSTEFCTCSSEEFIIDRNVTRNDESQDAFTIPPSKCDTNNKMFNYCAKYNADNLMGKGPCECVCRDQSATFAFQDNSWFCHDNALARNLFVSGCDAEMLFDNEQKRDKLTLITNDSDKKINWERKCTINLQLSSYIGCHGEGFSLRKVFSAKQMFAVEFTADRSENILELELPDYPRDNALAGRIVKLGINCQRPDSTTVNGCLLFKLQGRTHCPVTAPQTTTAVDRTVNTTPPVTTSQDVSAPDSAADREQSAGINSLSMGLIIGLTVSVTVIFFIVGIFVYRQHYARKHPFANSEGRSSNSNPGSKHGEENAGYATLSYRTSTTYASNYQIPFDNDGISTLDGEEPLYSTVDEYLDPATTEGPSNDRPFSVEQRVYNLVEGLDRATSDGPYDYGSHEGSQVPAPLSVEQRVYNVIEGLHTDTSDGPCDCGSNEEEQASQGPLSVEQRVYNMVEVLDMDTSDRGSQIQVPMSVEQRVYNTIEPVDTQNCEQPNSCDPKHKEVNEKPVYNLVEEPLPNDTEESKRNGSSSVKGPVYYVLEGPNPDKTEEPSNVSLDDKPIKV